MAADAGTYYCEYCGITTLLAPTNPLGICTSNPNGPHKLVAIAQVQGIQQQQQAFIIVKGISGDLSHMYKFVPNETILRLQQRLGPKLDRYVPKGFRPTLVRLSNASVIHLDDNYLVEPNQTYIACARYHRVCFKNVGNLDGNYFRRAVKSLCKKYEFGAMISRQGGAPFYDILVYCPSELEYKKFGVELIGPNWETPYLEADVSNEEKNPDLIANGIGKKADNYCCEIAGPCILTPNNQYGDNTDTLTHQYIIPCDVPADADGTRLTGDERAASSRASSVQAESYKPPPQMYG